ncbi:phage portal protein [Erysipelothrix anatis]|uniref:phage portal protein n=1 Tax=Erysipelothrix anatis TaxID=2683713 RepID=UPI001358AEC4|nr:phage portal protein [Erysipelothrix anatis]
MSLFRKLFKRDSGGAMVFDDGDDIAKKLHIKEFWIDHAVTLISETIGKADFKISSKKEMSGQTKSALYILNVQPNPNESSTEFWIKVIRKMMLDGECLVLNTGTALFRIKSAEVSKSVTVGRTYSKVVIEGPGDEIEELTKSYSYSDILKFTVPNEKFQNLVNNYYEDVGNYIASAAKSYRRSQSRKSILRTQNQNMPLADQNGKPLTFKEYADKLAGQVNSENDEIILLPAAIDLDDLSDKTSKNSEDITKFMKQFGDATAAAARIPIDVFYGIKTEKSDGTADLINFACMPYIKIIQNELDGKLSTEKEYFEGTRFILNKFALQYFNIISHATSIDKLRSVGFSHNDIMKALDEPIVDEEWANRRYVTKNYMNVESEGKEEENETKE